MKKTLIAVAAAAALTSSAFAEVTFGAWLRVLTAPVANDGAKTVTAMGNSWGSGARVARIDVNAASEDGKVGFAMGIYNDVSMSLSAGDEALIWAKPTDSVKLSFGKYDNNTLRGDMCYGAWNWLRPTSSWIAEDEGLLMSGNGGTGALVELTPVDGLYIQALAPIPTVAERTRDVYKKARAGMAYSIDGVGKIKAQWIGKNEILETKRVDAKAAEAATWKDSKGNKYGEAGFDADGKFAGSDTAMDFVQYQSNLANGFTYVPATAAVEGKQGLKDKKYVGDIEAEFDLTAVENLYLGVGVKYAMKNKDFTAADTSKMTEAEFAATKEKMKLAVGASFQATDELKVSASGAYFTYYKDSAKTQPKARYQAGAGIDYNLGNGLNLSADVRYLSKIKTKTEGGTTKGKYTDHVAFSVGATKGISSNGYIGVAFQGQTNSGNWANTAIPAAKKDKHGDDFKKLNKFTWCVPVAISCWF